MAFNPLEALQRRITGAKEQALGIQGQLGTLAQAQRGGLAITPQTSTQQAQQFLQPQPVPTQPVPATPPTVDALAGIAGGTSGDARKQIIDLITGLQGQQQKFAETLQAQPSASDLYAQFRGQLGLPEQEQTLTAQRQRIQKTEGLLDKLESDINSRISGKGITEPQRRRILASEQGPLAEQLEDLSRAAGITQTGVTSGREQLSQLLDLAMQEQQKQAGIAGMPFEFQKGLLPTLAGLAEYQSPREKLESEVERQRRLQEFEGAPGTITTEEGRYQWNPKTQRYDIFVGKGKETETKQLSQIQESLMASVGNDGFVDPGIYLNLRTQAKMGPDEFNKRFSYLLSPDEQINLGIKKALQIEKVENPFRK